MSSILDALKKLEEEQALDGAPEGGADFRAEGMPADLVRGGGLVPETWTLQLSPGRIMMIVGGFAVGLVLVSMLVTYVLLRPGEDSETLAAAVAPKEPAPSISNPGAAAVPDDMDRVPEPTRVEEATPLLASPEPVAEASQPTQPRGEEVPVEVAGTEDESSMVAVAPRTPVRTSPRNIVEETKPTQAPVKAAAAPVVETVTEQTEIEQTVVAAAPRTPVPASPKPVVEESTQAPVKAAPAPVVETVTEQTVVAAAPRTPVSASPKPVVEKPKPTQAPVVALPPAVAETTKEITIPAAAVPVVQEKVPDTVVAAPEPTVSETPALRESPVVATRLPDASRPRIPTRSAVGRPSLPPVAKKPASIKNLPMLSASARVRHGLEDLRLQMLNIKENGARSTHAVINRLPYFEGETILNIPVKLVKIEPHGIAIEILRNGDRYYIAY